MAGMPPLGVDAIIGSSMVAQQSRLSLIASNLANADTVTTPGGTPYRAMEPIFEAIQGANGTSTVEDVGTAQSSAPNPLRYDPGSPYANAAGYVSGSNVSDSQQMVDMIDATNSYSADVAMLTQQEKLDSGMLQSFIT